MTTENKTAEADAILADASPITLSTGREVTVQRLKTIQMLRLLRIFTKGIGDAITQIQFDTDDPENFGSTALMLAVLAIPEAEQETIEFVQSMVQPVELNPHPKTREERIANEEILRDFYIEMRNPEIDDLISIIEIVVTNEAPHILALGKRLATLLQAQQKSMTAKRGAAKTEK